MTNLNRCFLTGRIIGDIEIKENYKNNSPITKIILGVEHDLKINSKYKTKLELYEMVFYGKKIYSIKDKLSDGTKVLVEGQLSKYSSSGSNVIRALQIHIL